MCGWRASTSLPCSVYFYSVPGSLLCSFGLVASHDRELISIQSTTSHFRSLVSKVPSQEIKWVLG